MGRHASGPGPVAEAGSPRRVRLVKLGEHVAMGLGAGLVTALVLRWAGVAGHTALLVGLGALVVVPVLAWVASTVPAHPGQDDSSAPRRPRR